MPLLGWLIGARLEAWAGGWDYWIAVALIRTAGTAEKSGDLPVPRPSTGLAPQPAE